MFCFISLVQRQLGLFISSVGPPDTLLLGSDHILFKMCMCVFVFVCSNSILNIDFHN